MTNTLGIILAVIGVVLIVAAVVYPSQSVTIIFKPLAIVTEVSPGRMVITGTGIDAAILEFALGLALLIVGLYKYSGKELR